MTHEEILAQEDAGWQALMAAVEGLSDADWLLPGAAGEWTLRSGLLTTRAALLAMIQRIPAEWLARYKHMRNWIAAVTYEHYAEHVEMIHAWRAAA